MKTTKQTIAIIPEPLSISEKKGCFVYKNKTIRIVYDTFFYKVYPFYLELLSNSKLKDSFQKPKFFNKYSSTLKIEKKDSVGKFKLENPESYVLEITEETIIISASTAAGAFYGIQTLLQLAMSSDGELPCLFIFDKPAYQWRGFLLDTSRSFYSVDFIKKILDLCAFHKMNRFHWHLTDDQGWRIEIPEYPLLTKVGSERLAHTSPISKDTGDSSEKEWRAYYTDSEIEDVVQYAAARNITVVPEIELPGHVSALLTAYPEYGCTGKDYKVQNDFGIFDDVLCAGNDKIFTLYETIFKTLARLFPGKWIHIGGDECPVTNWESCPKCQKRMKDEGLENVKQLQSWITKKMTDTILSLGKTPIAWDEVIDNDEKNPVSKSIVVQSWRGIEGGEKASKLEHNVIMSPQTMCYMNLKNINSKDEPGRLGFITAKTAYSYSPITKGMDKKCAQFILGGEGAFWSEGMPFSRIVEYMLFPRFCAIAESLWLPEEKKDFTRFKSNLAVHKDRLKNMGILYYDGELE